MCKVRKDVFNRFSNPPASQGKHDSEEYLHPTVPAPLPKVNFGMCLEYKAMLVQPAESGLDQICSECKPVPKPRGNPKLRMQWLPETAGSEQIGTVCTCSVGFSNEVRFAKETGKTRRMQANPAQLFNSSERISTEYRPTGRKNESRI